MKRRVGSALLIATLLGAWPLRASSWPAPPVVRVEAASATPGQLEALCGAARTGAAKVRLISDGRARWLEISADVGADVAAALDALRRAAASAGVKLRVRSDPAGGELKAVSCRPVVLGDDHGAAGRGGPPAVLDPPQRPRGLPARPAWTDIPPGLERLAPPAGRAPRGPPA